MPFQFKLEKVLNYRTQLEEEAKVRLAQAHQLYIREEQRLAELNAMLQEKEAALYRDMTLGHGERWLLENYIRGLRSDISTTQMRLRSLFHAVEQAREYLLERSKDRKALEKLREKQEERYRAEERDKERKINDETATLRYKASAF